MTQLLRAIAVGAVPALFWLWTCHRRDRWEPEPKRLVLRLFLLGAAAALPVYFVQGWLPGGPRLYDNFVRAGLVEELFKILPVWVFALRRRELDEPMDGIVYAVAAALGFAAAENAFYALRLGETVALQRAFTSSLAHVGFAGAAGLHLGLAKVRRRPLLALRGLFVAVALHGLFDLLLSYAGHPRRGDLLARIALVGVVPLLLVLLWLSVRSADRASPHRPKGMPRSAPSPAPSADAVTSGGASRGGRGSSSRGRGPR